MSMFKVFDIAGSALSAQSIRMNTTASNLANANSVSSSDGETYRARQPIFEAVLQDERGGAASVGVTVKEVVESQEPLQSRYEPGHPMANEDGYIFMPNVNVVEELVNMIETQRAYEMNSKAISTADDMLAYITNQL